MVRVPEPFRVRSALEKITLSIWLSSMATYSPLLERVFWESGAVVINTLSALRT